jgi:hypothetical protein
MSRPLADEDVTEPPGPEDLHGAPTKEGLDRLQVTTIQYYLHEANPANGLIRDKTDPRAPCSIAAVGLALSAIPVLVEHGVIAREFAPEIALRRLRFFRDSPHGPERDAKASTTTSSTCGAGGASGTASCPRSTRRSSSQAC